MRPQHYYYRHPRRFRRREWYLRIASVLLAVLMGFLSQYAPVLAVGVPAFMALAVLVP